MVVDVDYFGLAIGCDDKNGTVFAVNAKRVNPQVFGFEDLGME